MKIAIILGNRMNDDGTISNTMKKRLDLTLELYNEYKPDKIIVSGGIANKVANISEASKMEEYLIEKGLDPELIIKEDNSMTTRENALYSVPIATVISKVVEFIVLVVALVVIKEENFKGLFKTLKISKTLVKEYIRKGIPLVTNYYGL